MVAKASLLKEKGSHRNPVIASCFSDRESQNPWDGPQDLRWSGLLYHSALISFLYPKSTLFSSCQHLGLLLIVPGTCQVCSYPRTFILAGPFSTSLVPHLFTWLNPLLPSQIFFNVTMSNYDLSCPPRLLFVFAAVIFPTAFIDFNHFWIHFSDTSSTSL